MGISGETVRNTVTVFEHMSVGILGQRITSSQIRSFFFCDLNGVTNAG